MDLYDIVTSKRFFNLEDDTDDNGTEAIQRHRELTEASHQKPRDLEDYLQLDKYGSQAGE